MSFKNPTYIQIGQTANYGGQTWRVAGRAVLGVLEDGEVYYWNEFNLETGTGETATLVFERTERGSEWRWFTQFTPEYPMTAADAATKEVGDMLNLEGTDVRVTLLETSRIYFTEGTAPEGEAVGGQASYFNAECGDEMIVVSWTGDEVEYYRGRTITNHEVRAAFQLSATERTGVAAGATSGYNQVEPSGFSVWRFVPALVTGMMVLILVVFIFKALFIFRPTRSQTNTGITRVSAPPAPLKVGATGQLAGINYHIFGHAQLEVAEVNLRFEQQAYYLRDDQNHVAVLIAGFHPHDPKWVLLTSEHPLSSMTPYQAAAVKPGQIVSAAGMVTPVDELFLTTVQDAEFEDSLEVVTGERFYGFTGERESQILLVSWNAVTISFWRGQNLSSNSVLAALGPAAPGK